VIDGSEAVVIERGAIVVAATPMLSDLEVLCGGDAESESATMKL
jgi:hypothetical protein